MKHRRVVGGPKKKNRIQEVNAATNFDDVNTSPLESPRFDDNGNDDNSGGVGAVQRFLTNRRNRREENHPGITTTTTTVGNLPFRPSSVSSSRGSTPNISFHSGDLLSSLPYDYNNDDEPDNDSGDEGLIRRRNALLGRETMPNSAESATAHVDHSSNNNHNHNLPSAKSSEALLPSLKKAPVTTTTTTTTTNPVGDANINSESATTVPRDTLSDNMPSLFKRPTSPVAAAAAGAAPVNATTHSLHPLLKQSTSTNATHEPVITTTTTTTTNTASLPANNTSAPHHRQPSVASVSFSMQPTDLESGEPLLHLASSSSFDNNNNNTTTSHANHHDFFGFLQPRTEITDGETPRKDNHSHSNNNSDNPNNNPVTINEETPLLFSAHDGSLQPRGIVDLRRATRLESNANMTDEDNDNDDDDHDGNDDDNDLELGSFHSEADSTVGGDNKDTNLHEDGQTAITGGQSLLEQLFEEGTTAIYNTITEVTTEAREQYDESCHYDWREFWKGGGLIKFVRWIATGTAPENFKQSDDEIQDNLNSLARMLSLLREYHERFGMPEVGGGKDQEYVLREVCKDLYLGGSPIWALEPVMKRVAEGLTGKRGVDFFLLPRRAFIFAPSSGATAMFRIARGYDMQRLDDMENVAVRLASFASNSGSVANVPTRWPRPQEMRRAFRTESLAGCYYSRDEMAEEILNLASDAEGLFYYIRNHESKCLANRDSPLYAKGDENGKLSQLGEFWTIEDDVRELFSRLAAIEAATAIDMIDVNRKTLYSPFTVILFRFCSSAGACAFWFNGSWVDIVISGVLAELVAMIGSSSFLSKQERIIFEAVASFVVGFVSACVALTWPESCCFGAMAISGVLDLLQGFRVVYSIIEIMSRHTVTGGADFLEGIFFTTLIAYCLRFGQSVALEVLGTPTDDEYMKCTKGISEWWFLLFVPVGAVAWSGLFNPHYFDLPIMAAHGILGYVVSWQFYAAASTTQMNNFVAAAAVTFSAGVLSRFTGRAALGNTVAGLYVLLPGAYLVTEVYGNRLDGFLWQIILRAIIIGIGGWTGTILCTPTLLGINKGLMDHNKAGPTLVDNGSMSDNMSTTSSVASGQHFRRRDKGIRKHGTGALLFF